MTATMTADEFYTTADQMYNDYQEEEIVSALVDWSQIPTVPEFFEPFNAEQGIVSALDEGLSWSEILDDMEVINVPAVATA